MTGVLNSLIAVLPLIMLLAHSQKSDDFFDPTERSTAVRWRGFFALLVILHHMAQRVSDPGLLLIYFDAGYTAVAMFFFYSGYGMMKKGIRGKNGFFRKRIPALLIPYAIAMVIYWVLYALTGDVKSIASLLLEHFNNASGISFLWYVFAYLAWLLFLGIALQLVKNERQIMYASWLFAAVYIAFCLLTIPKMYWIYSTVILIPAGCTWAYYEENIIQLIRKNYYKILVPGLICCIASCFGHMIQAILVPSYIVSALLFVLLLNMITMKRRPNGKVLAFLGGISYEIYVLHGIPVTFLRDAISNDALWTLSVLVIAVISAYIMSEAGKRIWKKPARS